MSYLRRPQKLSKSSPSIWHYLVSVKSTVNISSILENTNFKNSCRFHWPWNIQNQGGTFISHHGKLIKGKNEKVDLVLSNMKIWLELWEKDLAESNKQSNMNYPFTQNVLDHLFCESLEKNGSLTKVFFAVGRTFSVDKISI